MTVAELIAKLSTLPGEGVIEAGEGAGGGGEIWVRAGSQYVLVTDDA
jgi:hypothetical protein